VQQEVTKMDTGQYWHGWWNSQFVMEEAKVTGSWQCVAESWMGVIAHAIGGPWTVYTWVWALGVELGQ